MPLVFWIVLEVIVAFVYVFGAMVTFRLFEKYDNSRQKDNTRVAVLWPTLLWMIAVVFIVLVCSALLWTLAGKCADRIEKFFVNPKPLPPKGRFLLSSSYFFKRHVR